MTPTVANLVAAAHRVIPEISREMVKADLRKSENRDLKAEIGRCIDIARLRRGWQLEELAAALPAPDGAARRDPRQVQRWIQGVERAQFDVLFACADDAFVGELFEQLSPLSRRYESVTTLRRTA